MTEKDPSNHHDLSAMCYLTKVARNLLLKITACTEKTGYDEVNHLKIVSVMMRFIICQ